MSKLDDWLGIRERQGKPPEIHVVVKRAARPRAIRGIAKPKRLLAQVKPETLKRILAFQSRMPEMRTFNTIIDTLLNEALDARFFHLHPGQGRKLPTNFTLPNEEESISTYTK